MQRVVSINLNGNVYQLEEKGYNALFAYLDSLETQLKDDENRAQTLADIERTLAEKCQACSAPHKTVITAAEIDRIISELPPIASQPAGSARPADAPKEKDSTNAGTGEKGRAWGHTPRRLYRIRDGGMIGGVCLGLATFLNVDVTVVRILFALFTIATGGWGILAYVALMFILPPATTREQAARVGGTQDPQWPWDRDGWPWDRDGWPWDRHGWPWDRDLRREWRHQRRAARWEYRHSRSPLVSALIIVFFVMLGLAWLSFWTSGGVYFGWPFFWGGPFYWGFPHWLGIVLFFVFFRFLFMPLR